MSIIIGNTTIYFWPLIVTLVIAVIASFLFTLYLSLRVRKVRKSFEAGVYDKTIIDGEQLLKTYQKLDKRYKHRYKYMVNGIENLHFVLAVSYFSAMNWECFLSHINSLSLYPDVKNFWLSLYYIFQDNLDEAQLYYEKISRIDKNKTSFSYLESLICYKQGKYDLAKSKMDSIYMNLTTPLLKHLADQLHE